MDHYSEYPRGHIVVFFVQLPEGKSLGARVKEREAKLDRRLIYVPYIGCIALVGQRGVGGGNDEIALASQNVALSLYFSWYFSYIVRKSVFFCRKGRKLFVSK